MANNRGHRSTMPSKIALFRAWSKTTLFDLKTFWVDGPSDYGTKVCWACGWAEKHIDRCHIIALESGGSNDWRNLLLMCKGCHRQSEGMREDVFWYWFFGMNQAAADRRRGAGLEHLAGFFGLEGPP